MAAALVTLATAKAHLYITTPAGDPGDAAIQLKLDQAEDVILRYLKNPDPAWTAPDNTPGNVTAAILLLLTHLYEHRGDDQTPDANLWTSITNLLVSYRDPALA